MFFRKKKEELSDQRAVYQKRGAPRFTLLKTGINIDGYDGEGQVGNISVSGCCMGSTTYVAITPNETYTVRIIPAADEKIEPFSLRLKATWTKSSETLFLAGFSLDNGQSDVQMRRYVDLLNAKGIQADYGNMSPELRQ